MQFKRPWQAVLQSMKQNTRMLKMPNINTTRLPWDKDFHREYYHEYPGLKEVQSYSVSQR